MICAHAYKFLEMVSLVKVTGLNLLSVNCCCFVQKKIVKESCKFKLAHLKKKERKHFGCLATFWFGILTIFFHATGCVVGHEVLENEWYVVIKVYKLTIFFFGTIIYCVSEFRIYPHRTIMLPTLQ